MSVTLADGARFTTRRIRRVTGVNAREMVSGPCPVSAQCLKGEAYVESLSEARTSLVKGASWRAGAGRVKRMAFSASC